MKNVSGALALACLALVCGCAHQGGAPGFGVMPKENLGVILPASTYDAPSTAQPYLMEFGAGGMKVADGTGPNVAPSGLAGSGSDKQVLLTWTITPGLGGAYQVYRATTPGGPYTQANNRPVVAGVFFDDGSGQDLAPSTTYYYTVRHLDSHWQQSPASNEIAVETTASDGDWGISVAPHGTASPNVRTPTAIMFARNKLTNIFANAAAMGPTSSASTVTANATCSATWSATWSGNSFTSKPGMYVLDEVKSRSADVAISSAGDTAVATSGGATLLSAQNPVGLTSYSTLPIITDTVDSSDPGHYVFRIDRRTDERKVGVDARGGGLTERVNDTTHIIHVFTPAYFDAHFTDPKLIKMSMIIPQTDVDATVTLHAGAPAGATAEAAGTVSDEYRNYDERL